MVSQLQYNTIKPKIVQRLAVVHAFADTVTVGAGQATAAVATTIDCTDCTTQAALGVAANHDAVCFFKYI